MIDIPVKFIDMKGEVLLETSSTNIPYLPRMEEMVQLPMSPIGAYKGVYKVYGVFHEFDSVGVVRRVRFILEPMTV